MKEYKAMIWNKESTDPGKRVVVIANDLHDAKTKLESKYGKGNVFDLHNEEDARKPRV